MKTLTLLFTCIIASAFICNGQTEISYDDGTFTGWWNYTPERVVAVHFSPTGPCEVVALKYYLTNGGTLTGTYIVALYDWEDTQPSAAAVFEGNPGLFDEEGWEEAAVPAVYFDGDFVGGLTLNDAYCSIAIDEDLQTGRNWVNDISNVTWTEITDYSFLIRAIVEYTTGEIEELEGKPISLYPNPANESIYIKLEDQAGYTTLEIVNINGQVIYTTSLNGNEKTINLKREQDWRNGLYFIRLSGHNQTFTEEIILK